MLVCRGAGVVRASWLQAMAMAAGHEEDDGLLRRRLRQHDCRERVDGVAIHMKVMLAHSAQRVSLRR